MCKQLISVTSTIYGLPVENQEPSQGWLKVRSGTSTELAAKKEAISSQEIPCACVRP